MSKLFDDQIIFGQNESWYPKYVHLKIKFFETGGWINIKMSSYQYRKFHSGDKTILRPSYLHNGISYMGKMTSLYWIRALVLLLRELALWMWPVDVTWVHSLSVVSVSSLGQWERTLRNVTSSLIGWDCFHLIWDNRLKTDPGYTISVTADGKLYACGEATNGRLGLGITAGNVPVPRQLTSLSQYVIKKVAVHSGGWQHTRWKWL